MMQVYDLSQPIESEMTVYPSDPQPVIKLEEQAFSPWRITSLSLGSHTGTHIDAASHYFSQGRTVDQYPLERFLPRGIVIPLPGLEADASIPSNLIEPYLDSLQTGSAVLLHTGWDRYWKQEHYYHHPYLSQAASQQLVEAGVRLVGIDALNIDSTQLETDRAHQVLLGNDIPIVENLARLDQLQPGKLYQMSFLPLYLPGVDGSPIRAAAWEIAEK